MSITTCPHCQMRVLPRPDGTCPSCNGLIAQTEPPPPSKPSGTVVKRAAKPVERRKTAAKSGVRPPSPTPPNVREIEPVYHDYLQTAKEVRKGSLRVFYPYLVGGIIIAAVCIAVSFLTWEQVLADAGLTRQPGTTTWVLILLGVALMLGVIVLGAFKGDGWAKAQVRLIALDRPGFPDFFKAFLRRVWPKDGTIGGPAFDKFLTILGKK